MHVLVTGGCGYIGSHTVAELVGVGHRVTVVDNLSNSSALALRRVEELSGRTVAFAEFDLCDADRLDALFGASRFDAVIHFAGLKAVAESIRQPLDYYAANLGSTLTLARTMAAHDVRRLVFSSSATVYGDPPSVPIVESTRVAPTNPYGQTKAMIEQILRDLVASGGGWQITMLRYFNPVGAHRSGQIGEDPTGIPNNLLPFVAQVAVGRQPRLEIFGNDYDTPDGTGVRDYIHVVDLAEGHVAALGHLPPPDSHLTVNLGTGTGSSVLEVVAAFEAASGRTIPYVVMPRRPGDVAAVYAKVSLAEDVLKWKAGRTLADACADAWRWQSQHPNGYR